MWMSMTGFGRGERSGEDVSVIVEIRSVNHRFLDIHVRCPGKFLSWETRIRTIVRQSLRRGKVDVFLGVRDWGRAGAAVRVNRSLLSSFLEEARSVQAEFSLPGEVRFRDLVGIPDIILFASEGDDSATELWSLAESALREGLAMLAGSRKDEGERMRAAIGTSVGSLRALADEITALAGENKELARSRFRERIESLAGEAGIDPARIHQEGAYLVDRLDISEECERLRSHLAGLDGLLAGPGEAVGKRFDFLVQEVFRELNTASTKSAHAGISARVVDAKVELEKIREQIQNVE